MSCKGKWVESKKETPAATEEPRTGQRQQPKRKSRQQRGGAPIAGPKGTSPKKPNPPSGSSQRPGNKGSNSGGKNSEGPKSGKKKRKANGNKSYEFLKLALEA